MDHISADAFAYRIALLESKLQGFKPTTKDTLDRLKGTIDKEKELNRLVQNLKEAKLYGDVEVGRELIDDKLSVQDRKVLILSRYERLSKFVTQVDQTISLMEVVDRFERSYREIYEAREKMGRSFDMMLKEYERIYEKYERGVRRMIRLLEVGLGELYERNQIVGAENLVSQPSD